MKEITFYRTYSYGGMEGRDKEVRNFETVELAAQDALKDTWNEHVENNAIHVAESDKTRWNNKSDFSGNYNDLEDAPDISDDGTGQLKFVDEAGNIIMQLDDQGLHSTNLELTKDVKINDEIAYLFVPKNIKPQTAETTSPCAASASLTAFIFASSKVL